LQITATVNATGNYSNTAIVTGNETDPNPANNDSTATVNPGATADLSLVKTVNNHSANVGTNVIFTIAVTNNGLSDATGVKVTDNLPNGYTYVSDNGAGNYVSATGIWTVGSLPNGASASLQITATVNATGNYSNTAIVTGNETDPNEENNTSNTSVTPENTIFVPEGISPNNDGLNDKWVITGLAQYPNHKVIILNRWGDKVYEASPYLNDWDGTNMYGVSVGNNNLPEGTYFYIIETGEPGVKPIKGYIYLKR
jgi:gliding motility-associated-like protein/uncharacterized repeat protein (TIGR01451 family)